MSFIESVRAVIEPKIKELGYELYELNFAKEGQEMHLIVRIDRPGTHLGLEHIVLVSEALSVILDHADIIDVNYVLDVSSAGAERRIDVKDLARYIGQYVNLHLSNPLKGLNTYEGDLLDLKDGKLLLSYRDKTRTIQTEIRLDDVDRARLAIKF
jgi:ribosome maturation factor RimP